MPETGDRKQSALELAYRYLNRRERTKHEVRRHLVRQNLDEQAISGAIETLEEQGYLDDARFVRLFAADKRELHQWGTERIARALRARGISFELTSELLGREPRELELRRACELLVQRFPAPPRTRRERDRALGLMLRKGYGCELALDALVAHAHGELRSQLQ
jgi:regulatory protein